MDANEIKFKDKVHPEVRANFISKLFFCWFIPTFIRGYKTPLEEKDLYNALPVHNSITLGDKLENAWNNELARSKNPSLWKVLLKTFKLDFLFTGAMYFFNEFALKLGQPICISQLLLYYNPNSTMTKKEAYFYAGMVVVLSMLQVIISHNVVLRLQHLGMKMRVACCSLIYRKTLRLNKSALVDTTIGQMVNLLSNDVNRFDFSMIHVHHLWGAPIETVIVMYLLYSKLGLTSIVGVGFLLTFIPLQMYMGKRTSVYRLRTAIRTDERVRLMNEILSGIQVIKMYTWEKPFAKLVEIARRSEMVEITKNSMLRALTLSFALFMNRISIYFCILTYVLVGNTVNAEFVYSCVSFYSILRQAVTMFLPQAVTSMAECNVSVKRIKTFLLYEEIHDENEPVMYVNDNSQKEKQNGLVLKSDISSKSIGIFLQDGACRWSSSSPESTLSGINFSVSENQLVAIIGPVGSGKTTLLHVLLKELSLEGGTLEVNGRVSYASQEPWLFGGSVRQNILFGQEYNENKYKEVVRVCALERDFTLFPYGDKTIVGERGTMLSGGQRARINLARAVYKDADIYLLDDPLSAVDTHVGKQLFEDCISKYLGDKCVVLVTHQLQYLHKVSRIDLLEDGKISISGTYQQLQNSGRDFTNLLNEHKDEHNDDEEKKDRKSKHEVMEEDKPGEPTEVKEHVEKGKISGEVYRRYFKAGGRLWQAFAMLIIFILAQVIGNGNDYFVTWWVNYEQDKLAQANFTNTTETFWDTVFFEYNGLYIYTSFAVMVVVMVVSRSVIFYKFCMVASRKLHDNMFNNVVFATMEFFNNNPSGRILNRFSKDMGAVDENLPGAMIDTIQIGLNVLGISIVVGIVNPWVLLSTVVILTIFYGIRVVYLATSRNIKRMEGTTRSPVFSHLSASLQGLTTIRAFGAQEILREEFDKHQNLHSSAFYMFLVAGKTFGFWLDFHCVIYIALVVVSFLFIEKESYGGNVGLAITQSMGLCGQFQWGMRQWSELENMMTAVERVLEYTEIKPEPQGVVKEPPKFWPEEGNVKFESVYMKYSENEPFVLKDLSFDVKRGEKVGIVGRTGAGKSSLVSALFRLCQIEGKIIIDNVNTKEISLENLRSKISIIPQEPVLFSGTLRKNLDPFDHHNDDVIWSALEQVELKGAIDDLASGLESKISEGGSNFSVGQRQLLCLARAIIRKNKILILDEATANVDPQTDALIQTTIRDKFGDCTVLTIAHRLNTIMDSDKVLVMDSGTVVEFDHPHNLLQNKDGIFASLVKQTGRAMSDNLTAIAEMNYNMRKDE